MIRGLFSTLIVVFLSVTCFSAPVQAAWLWSPESGKWTNTKDVPKDTPEEQFLIGKSYFDKEDYGRSTDEFDKVIKHYSHSRWAAEAQFYKGMSYEQQGDIGKASEAFKVLVDRYPYSERLNDAIEHEFELAEAMLEGKKTKFLGMKIMPAQDTAAQLYRHIVRAAPYGPYGAVSQFRLAAAELATGNYDAAERAYQAVIDDYPNSDYAVKAKFEIAQVSYKSAMKEAYHEGRTDQALTKYEGFKRSFPESDLHFEANEAIRELRIKKAKSIYDIAHFYQRRKKYKSSRIYYQDVVDQYPETDYAERAKQELKTIENLEHKEGLPVQDILGIIPIHETMEEEEFIAMQPKTILGVIPIPSTEEKKTEESTPVEAVETVASEAPATEAVVEETPQAEAPAVDPEHNPNRRSFLGIIRLPDAVPQEEKPKEEPNPNRRSFLGIIRLPDAVPQEEKPEAEHNPNKRSFLGVIPLPDAEPKPIRRQGRSFLGLIPLPDVQEP